MKVTKFGHCCLLIEENGARILLDPGSFSIVPDVANIDAILITHEHADHYHLESLNAVRAKNPNARVITNEGVGKLLKESGIPHELIEDGQDIEVKGVSVGGRGEDHACIHADIPLVRNIGFLIAGRLFYPGDAFHAPVEKVEILALPVIAPWMRLEEAVEYAKKIKPRVVFPVHDGMLRQDRMGFSRRIPTSLLEPLGIEFRDMGEGSVEEF